MPDEKRLPVAEIRDIGAK